MVKAREGGLRLKGEASHQRPKRTAASSIRGRYIPPNTVCQTLVASSGLVLTSTPTLIPSLTVTILEPGRYAFSGDITFVHSGAGDIGYDAIGELYIGATPAPSKIYYRFNSQHKCTVGRRWIIGISVPNTTVQLRASKDVGATGSSTALSQHSTLTVEVAI